MLSKPSRLHSSPRSSNQSQVKPPKLSPTSTSSSALPSQKAHLVPFGHPYGCTPILLDFFEHEPSPSYDQVTQIMSRTSLQRKQITSWFWRKRKESLPLTSSDSHLPQPKIATETTSSTRVRPRSTLRPYRVSLDSHSDGPFSPPTSKRKRERTRSFSSSSPVNSHPTRLIRCKLRKHSQPSSPHSNQNNLDSDSLDNEEPEWLDPMLADLSTLDQKIQFEDDRKVDIEQGTSSGTGSYQSPTSQMLPMLGTEEPMRRLSFGLNPRRAISAQTNAHEENQNSSVSEMSSSRSEWSWVEDEGAWEVEGSKVTKCEASEEEEEVSSMDESQSSGQEDYSAYLEGLSSCSTALRRGSPVNEPRLTSSRKHSRVPAITGDRVEEVELDPVLFSTPYQPFWRRWEGMFRALSSD